VPVSLDWDVDGWGSWKIFLITNSHFPQLFLEKRLPDNWGTWLFLINSAWGLTPNPNKVFKSSDSQTFVGKKKGARTSPPVLTQSSRHPKNLGVGTPIFGSWMT
jgi:hypothetical protein